MAADRSRSDPVAVLVVVGVQRIVVAFAADARVVDRLRDAVVVGVGETVKFTMSVAAPPSPGVENVAM